MIISFRKPPFAFPLRRPANPRPRPSGQRGRAGVRAASGKGRRVAHLHAGCLDSPPWLDGFPFCFFFFFPSTFPLLYDMDDFS